MTSTSTIIFVLFALQFANGQNCPPEEPRLKLRKEQVKEPINGTGIIYKGRVFEEGEFSESKGFFFICKCDVIPCIKTCTDLEKGEFFAPKEGFEIDVELEDGTSKRVDFYKHFYAYSETRDCTLFTLHESGYKILSNGSFLIESVLLDNSEFCIAMEKTGELSIKMCEEDLDQEEIDIFYETVENYKTFSIEISVSACFLLLALIAILVSSERQTMLGILSICFCTTLIIFYLISAIVMYYIAEESDEDSRCTSIAFLLLIVGLSPYCWLTSMCLEYYLAERDRKVVRLIGFAIFSTIVPCGFYLIAFAVEWMDHEFLENCNFHDIPLLTQFLDWPSGVICLANFPILAFTIYKQRLVAKWVVVNVLLTILMIIPPLTHLFSTWITEISSSTKVFVFHFNCLSGIFVFVIIFFLLLPQGCCSKHGVYRTQQQSQ
ncbi:uncharacterized protein LOC135941641 [Cloeon dipterum]|uniref:uncharacterized protein LOC135941641 n=1 Tax=Cloeon dipterum TaxID=197152 RepID=UPI00321FBC3E